MRIKLPKKYCRNSPKRKKIIPVKVTGSDEQYYTTKSKLKELDKASNNKHIHILSPFDNLVIQRKRMTTLFGFEYIIECYVPAPKRKFGYFCLPVLYGDKFIGRLDAKADRQSGVFKVINFFPEEGVKINAKMKSSFDKKMMELARFSGCEEVKHK